MVQCIVLAGWGVRPPTTTSYTKPEILPAVSVCRLDQPYINLHNTINLAYNLPAAFPSPSCFSSSLILNLRCPGKLLPPWHPIPKPFHMSPISASILHLQSLPRTSHSSSHTSNPPTKPRSPSPAVSSSRYSSTPRVRANSNLSRRGMRIWGRPWQ